MPSNQQVSTDYKRTKRMAIFWSIGLVIVLSVFLGILALAPNIPARWRDLLQIVTALGCLASVIAWCTARVIKHNTAVARQMMLLACENITEAVNRSSHDSLLALQGHVDHLHSDVKSCEKKIKSLSDVNDRAVRVTLLAQALADEQSDVVPMRRR